MAHYCKQLKNKSCWETITVNQKEKKGKTFFRPVKKGNCSSTITTNLSVKKENKFFGQFIKIKNTRGPSLPYSTVIADRGQEPCLSLFKLR